MGLSGAAYMRTALLRGLRKRRLAHLFALCRVMHDVLSALDYRLARAAFAQVFQLCCIWHPTMAVALTWDRLELSEGPEIFPVVMGRDRPGRKDKRVAAKRIRHCVPPSVPITQLHPVALVYAFFDDVQTETRRFWSVMPLAVRRLLGEGSRAFATADMGKWLTQAAARTPEGYPSGITPRCHRSGSSTMHYPLLRTYREMCYLADWELMGVTYSKTCYRPTLSVDLAVARFFFADLASKG